MSVDGLHGPFIVEDKPGSFPFYYDEERVILLTDEYRNTSWQLEDYLRTADPTGIPRADPVPAAGLLCLYDETNKASVTSSCSKDSSGQGFNLNFKPAKVYRLRIICGSIIAPFIFSIDQHELRLVAADYSTLDGNAWVKGIPMMVSPGLRIARTRKLIVSDSDWPTIRCPRPGRCHCQTERGVLGQGDDAASVLWVLFLCARAGA